MNPIAKRTCAALSTAALVVLAILLAPPAVLEPAFCIVFLLAALESYQLVARRVNPLAPKGLLVWVPCLVLAAIAFTVLPTIALRAGNVMMLYVIAIVKMSDMGGFALGVSSAKLMTGGNHKLCPTISPNKSWEGLLGSVLAACILSCLFMPLTKLSLGLSVLLGVVAAVFGTAGDLVESKLKRWAGVKDSSTFMPADMGGFLDMFDSLAFAPAVIFCILKLTKVIV